MYGPLSRMYELKKGIKTKRVSSYNPQGSNHDYIRVEAGETAEIALISGAGIIRHLWFTFNAEDPFFRRNTVIRMYWDGETNPSVEAPIGDFFGQGWGESYNFVSLPLAAAPLGGRALNSYFPMPFGDGARITIENQSAMPIPSLYFYIDYGACFHTRYSGPVPCLVESGTDGIPPRRGRDGMVARGSSRLQHING
jgi:hypothetical protein